MSKETITLITEAFDSHNIKYRVVDLENLSYIDAGFNIAGGPTVRFHFVSQGEDDHGVQIRINGLMNKVGKDKREAILEACNKINQVMRFYKFYLDKQDCLFGQADLPTGTSDERVGENTYELFMRGMQILDHCYHFFPEAYYSSPAKQKGELLLNTLNALQDLRDNPVIIPDDEQESK